MMPIDIACPHCDAAAGEKCHTLLPPRVSRGYVKVLKNKSHSQRWRALTELQGNAARLQQWNQLYGSRG